MTHAHSKCSQTPRRRSALTTALLFSLTPFYASKAMALPPHIELVLRETKPLEHPRGNRLPLYLWPAMNPGPLEPADAEQLVRDLDARGIGLVCAWHHTKRDESLAECLTIARAQHKLGVPVNVNTTTLLYGFFDGRPETAHRDADGNPFFDESFGKAKIGCPFRVEHRIPAIRQRVVDFADAYRDAGLPVDFIFADWEIDGPLEWNDAHAAAKRCRICREHLPQLDDFLAFQFRVRKIRSRLQRRAYAEPILARFPHALVGNYAVYPHDGWRYWYDYFERYEDGQPARTDQRAKYRHWANEFADTGYTFAMPVVYPWSWTFHWYDHEPADYRWFYNGLLVASNAGRHAPPDVPIIAFVHYHLVKVGPTDAPSVEPMTEHTYRELLWHMLLRGTDTFFLWCGADERAKEVQLLHPVWAAAQQYGDFLERGRPVVFDVPKTPGPVVSALQLGNRVLVRRTDFTDAAAPVEIRVADTTLSVPRAPGRVQILHLDQ
jgi:hypothetical protein